jgi:hypothetical protein
MQLELHALGWNGPMAYADVYFQRAFDTKVEASSFRWVMWSIPDLLLSPPASLRMVQGVKPQKLLDNAWIRTGGLDSPGPFLLVRGDYRSYDAPPKMTRVLLAHIDDLPSSIPMEQAVGAIVNVALAT